MGWPGSVIFIPKWGQIPRFSPLQLLSRPEERREARGQGRGQLETFILYIFNHSYLTDHTIHSFVDNEHPTPLNTGAIVPSNKTIRITRMTLPSLILMPFPKMRSVSSCSSACTPTRTLTPDTTPSPTPSTAPSTTKGSASPPRTAHQNQYFGDGLRPNSQ